MLIDYRNGPATLARSCHIGAIAIGIRLLWKTLNEVDRTSFMRILHFVPGNSRWLLRGTVGSEFQVKAYQLFVYQVTLDPTVNILPWRRSSANI